jgi:hypothetical protein
MERQKMELEVNKPTKIKLLYNECVIGTSKFGTYHLYNFLNGDGTTEYSLFAADELHKLLKLYKKDDELLVTKLAANRSDKLVVAWDVKKIGGKVAVEPTVNNQTNLTNPNDDFLYTAMEKSLEQSISLAKRFNSVPIDKLAF